MVSEKVIEGLASEYEKGTTGEIVIKRLRV